MSENHIHAIILTLNEEAHIARCIKSIMNQCESVTLIDSGSTDETVRIAESLGAHVIGNKWKNYATQLNFGIQQLANRSGWLLRIDADEVFDSDSLETLKAAAARAGQYVDGIAINRRIHFMGRRIRFGAMEPSWQLRLWRAGTGKCEERWMDEHIIVDGEVMNSKVVFSDINLNSLSWWTDKHNSYASREAIDALNMKYGFLEKDVMVKQSASPQAKWKRFFKEHVYSRIPMGARSAAYFVYRYFLRLGFLDGRAGAYWHLLQGLWYRTLVDAKIVEIEDFASKHQVGIVEAIRIKTGITLSGDKHHLPQAAMVGATDDRNNEQ